jgi:hypothetical protein
MGIRNQGREELKRLASKTLDARFVRELTQGLNCSRFEAEAVLDLVKEVYFPYWDESGGAGPPGRVTVMAVSAEEPAGKAVRDCETRPVSLTVHRGAQDDALLKKEGPNGFRRARLTGLCQEAMSQGGLLTREDLAYRIFFVSPRTISRDLAALRLADPLTSIPLRSTVHDIGPVLTHRVEIVRLALVGKTTTEICAIMRHSPAAVANYLSTFIRSAQLDRLKMQPGQIAFLLRRGPGLIKQYLSLLRECEADKNMSYHLEELLRLGRIGSKKSGKGKRS